MCDYTFTNCVILVIVQITKLERASECSYFGDVPVHILPY